MQACVCTSGQPALVCNAGHAAAWHLRAAGLPHLLYCASHIPKASERGRACTESGNAQIGDDAGAVQAYACFCDSNCAALLAALLAAAMCSLQAARFDAAARACAAARSARSSCSWTTRTRSCMSCSPGAAAAPAPRISHPGYAARALFSDTSNTPNTSSSMQKKPPPEELPRWP